MKTAQATGGSKGIICADHNISFPSHMNFGIYFVEKLLNFKDKIALVNGETGEELSFSEIARQIVTVSASLSSLGVGRGDVASVVSENRPEVVTTAVAVLCSGASVTFINSSFTKGEILHATSITNPKYVFLSPKAYENHSRTFREQGSVRKIFIFGDSPSAEVMSYNELVNKRVDFTPVDFYGRVEPALILYSSGTTGLPKGARLTHANLIASAQQTEPCPELSLLSVAPWCSTLGYISVMKALINYKKVIYLQRFQEKQYLETIEKYKAETLVAAPPLVVLLSKSPQIDQYDLSSMKFIYCGGAPLDESVILKLQERLPHISVLQGYGTTETAGTVTEETTTNFKLGSVGKVVQGIVMKVVDVATRKPLGSGQLGEICLNGPVLFDGYIGKSRADDFDEDGFYRTGDIAYYDENGYFFIKDRIKELIKYKGWQVSPAELEALLLEHPAVKDVGVTGAPDPDSGELPTAFVVKLPGHDVTEKDIVEFVASRVSPWKRLRGGVRFIEDVPKTASGKILRRKLRDMLKTTQSKL